MRPDTCHPLLLYGSIDTDSTSCHLSTEPTSEASLQQRDVAAIPTRRRCVQLPPQLSRGLLLLLLLMPLCWWCLHGHRLFVCVTKSTHFFGVNEQQRQKWQACRGVHRQPGVTAIEINMQPMQCQPCLRTTSDAAYPPPPGTSRPSVLRFPHCILSLSSSRSYSCSTTNMCIVVPTQNLPRTAAAEASCFRGPHRVLLFNTQNSSVGEREQRVK